MADVECVLAESTGDMGTGHITQEHTKDKGVIDRYDFLITDPSLQTVTENARCYLNHTLKTNRIDYNTKSKNEHGTLSGVTGNI